MDADGNVDRTRGNVKHTYVSSLHAIGLDHDVRALGFHAAGEDVECAAGARDRGGAAGAQPGDAANTVLRAELRGGGFARDNRGGEGGHGGVPGLHGRARRGDDAGGGGGDGEGHLWRCGVRGAVTAAVVVVGDAMP